MIVLLRTIILILFSISIFSCYHGSEFIYHDPYIQMNEYEMITKLQNKDKRKVAKGSNTSLMKISDGILPPEEPRVIADKVVSISVTEETPIVDVLMELARMSGTNIQIDPTIVGGVNLNFKDVSLENVFKRICGLTDIRYRQKYGILVFERDIPYAKSYTLDFLDMQRNISSSITVNTSGLSSSNTGGGTSTVTANSSDSFWDDIVNDIKQIIQTTENTNRIYTQTAERIQRIAKTEEEANLLQQDINSGVYNGNNQQKQNSDKDASTKLLDEKISDDIIRLNKRAGILTITASTKSHLQIEKYLEQLKRKATSQVLIEMRFLEINLNKQYKAGIDWTKIGLFGIGSITSTLGIAQTVSNLTSFKINKGIDATASLLEQFGSTRTLANPRINALNNQPAMMTIATNYVYFKTKSNYTPSQYNAASGYTTQGYRNVESEAQTIPLGIIMSVLPSIDIDKREVILNIRPTISKLEKTVKDPAVTVVLNDPTAAGVTENDNQIPVANVRELDTILKLKDGQTAIIGGFTERIAQITETGVPIMRALPIFGKLFANKNDTSSATETILLVKATIVDNGKRIDEYEKGVYDSFSDDPRMNDI